MDSEGKVFVILIICWLLFMLLAGVFTKCSFDYDTTYQNEPVSIIGTSCGEDYSDLIKYEIGDYYLCTECKQDDQGVYVWFEDEYCEKWKEEIE